MLKRKSHAKHGGSRLAFATGTRIGRMGGLAIAMILICLLAGCNRPDAGKAEDSTGHADAEYSRINGRNFTFVPDEEKQKWVEPLAKLLSNERTMIGDRSVPGMFSDGYNIPDPDAPYIEKCFSCGLLDVTGDGTPELLVYPFGYAGSSGTETYFIYDIYTGQKLGSLSGGGGGTWCAYYDMEADTLRYFNDYWLRLGWAEREQYLSILAYSEDEKEYHSRVYLYVDYQMDAVETEVVDEGSGDGSHKTEWDLIYTAIHHKIWGQDTNLDTYYECMTHFNQTCIRIPETELLLVDWDDVSSDEDDRFVRAEKMAKALISSEQQYIDPEK